jgi:Ribbon-helix-helix protein, copG family
MAAAGRPILTALICLTYDSANHCPTSRRSVWCAHGRIPHRRAHLLPAQTASEISRQTDVARRRVYRTDGRDLRAARRIDARFRFLSLSQTWPSSAHAYSPGGGVDDRGHQLRARRLWARKLKAVRNGRAIYDMGCRMKITLNIDDTVMAELKHEAARQGRTMSELVETALRLLLSSQRKRGNPRVTKVPQRRGARRCCRPRCPVSTRPWKVLVLEVVRAHRLPSGTRCCGLQRSVLPIQAG